MACALALEAGHEGPEDRKEHQESREPARSRLKASLRRGEIARAMAYASRFRPITRPGRTDDVGEVTAMMPPAEPPPTSNCSNACA